MFPRGTDAARCQKDSLSRVQVKLYLEGLVPPTAGQGNDVRRTIKV
jgi:hypothetical protein